MVLTFTGPPSNAAGGMGPGAAGVSEVASLTWENPQAQQPHIEARSTVALKPAHCMQAVYSVGEVYLPNGIATRYLALTSEPKRTTDSGTTVSSENSCVWDTTTSHIPEQITRFLPSHPKCTRGGDFVKCWRVFPSQRKKRPLWYCSHKDPFIRINDIAASNLLSSNQCWHLRKRALNLQM